MISPDLNTRSLKIDPLYEVTHDKGTIMGKLDANREVKYLADCV